jgi:hypothetical protein
LAGQTFSWHGESRSVKVMFSDWHLDPVPPFAALEHTEPVF